MKTQLLALLLFALSGSLLAEVIPKDYEPFLPGYKFCMESFDQEKRLACLESSLAGLQARSLHRNGPDGAKTTETLSIKECGSERSTDALLCRIKVIDFLAH